MVGSAGLLWGCLLLSSLLVGPGLWLPPVGGAGLEGGLGGLYSWGTEIGDGATLSCEIKLRKKPHS